MRGSERGEGKGMQRGVDSWGEDEGRDYISRGERKADYRGGKIIWAEKSGRTTECNKWKGVKTKGRCG